MPASAIRCLRLQPSSIRQPPVPSASLAVLQTAQTQLMCASAVSHSVQCRPRAAGADMAPQTAKAVDSESMEAAPDSGHTALRCADGNASAGLSKCAASQCGHVRTTLACC